MRTRVESERVALIAFQTCAKPSRIFSLSNDARVCENAIDQGLRETYQGDG
jgi:hypothetical protein